MYNLNPELLDRLQYEARRALNGDGSCSLENMQVSCFASERCANGDDRIMELRDIYQSSWMAYVALREGSHFCGCVSVTQASSSPTLAKYFPLQKLVFPDALLLSNLCASYSERGIGLGSRLVYKILAHKKPVYLLVSKIGLAHSNEDIVTAYSKRVPKLKDIYKSMGFKIVDEESSDVAILFLQKPPLSFSSS